MRSNVVFPRASQRAMAIVWSPLSSVDTEANMGPGGGMHGSPVPSKHDFPVSFEAKAFLGTAAPRSRSQGSNRVGTRRVVPGPGTVSGDSVPRSRVIFPAGTGLARRPLRISTKAVPMTLLDSTDAPFRARCRGRRFFCRPLALLRGHAGRTSKVRWDVGGRRRQKRNRVVVAAPLPPLPILLGVDGGSSTRRSRQKTSS